MYGVKRPQFVRIVILHQRNRTIGRTKSRTRIVDGDDNDYWRTTLVNQSFIDHVVLKLTLFASLKQTQKLSFFSLSPSSQSVFSLILGALIYTLIGHVGCYRYDISPEYTFGENKKSKQNGKSNYKISDFRFHRQTWLLYNWRFIKCLFMQHFDDSNDSFRQRQYTKSTEWNKRK